MSFGKSVWIVTWAGRIRVIYIESMLKQYIKILKSHAGDVFGYRAKEALSFYTILAIASVVLPTVFLIGVLVSKIF